MDKFPIPDHAPIMQKEETPPRLKVTEGFVALLLSTFPVVTTDVSPVAVKVTHPATLTSVPKVASTETDCVPVGIPDPRKKQ